MRHPGDRAFDAAGRLFSYNQTNNLFIINKLDESTRTGNKFLIAVTAAPAAPENTLPRPK
jgi:hypothetical protein